MVRLQARREKMDCERSAAPLCVAWQVGSTLQGQLEDEARAGSGRAVDVDRAAVSLDDAPDDREPEARPLPVSLGRKERYEDVRKVLGGDAGAAVVNDDDHRSRRAGGELRADRHRAASLGG